VLKNFAKFLCDDAEKRAIYSIVSLRETAQNAVNNFTQNGGEK
jgi:hypothetical protein